MRAVDGKNWPDAYGYAKGIIDGTIVANIERVQCAERFLRDLENPAYEIDSKGPEFCIQIIEKTLCHQQGEALDGTPLRGKPFLLQPFHKFIVYNLIGFVYTGTKIVRFHEALIFIPRKNVKTTFAAALAWALCLWYRKSGAKMYVSTAALKQSMETFSFLKYNIRRMKEEDKQGGHVHIIDNNNEHSMSAQLPDGSFFIQALASNPDAQDSLNCNVAICDEIHAFKTTKQYNLFKEAMKAYTNKLMIGISTAGDDANGFLGQRLKYCRSILEGTIVDEQYFVFIACANPDENGNIDYTNPIVHQQANPSYGVTIRPQDIMSEALQAQNDPQQRKDFFAKSLNVFTNAMKAYFDIREFQNSDKKYNWTLEELAKLPIKWFGGADLSKMHDLTAAVLYGHYNGVDIIIPHCWFPVVAAHEKADKDNIPLFGWMDDGWLTMCNTPTTEYSDIVRWFIEMRKMGFKIIQVGHDRKFGREYIRLMKKAGFRIIDQPQYYYVKSEGFRHIEKAAKDGRIYYLHASPYEYCVENVRAVEKTDDMIMYQKIQDTYRIDVFDASVFACVRYLETIDKSEKANEYLGGNS